MRAVRRKKEMADGRLPAFTIDAIERGVPNQEAAYVSADERHQAVCVRCDDRWCGRFAELSRTALRQPRPVCPTNAITFEASGQPSVSDACIGCGICVARCPYGGIELEDGRAIPVAAPESYRPASAEEVRAVLDTADMTWTAERADEDAFIVSTVASLGYQRKDSYYPLVATLLTAAGMPTELPSHGSNPARFDAVIVDGSHSIPIEIKSPAEEAYPGVKAVEQALENKILLDTRFAAAYPSTPETATLAVGHALPPARSDIEQLIADIENAYGIKVGVLALAQLYDLFFQSIREGQDVPVEALSQHHGF